MLPSAISICSKCKKTVHRVDIINGLCLKCAQKRADRLPAMNIEDIPEKLILEQSIRIIQSRIKGIMLERYALKDKEDRLIKLMDALQLFSTDTFV